MSKKFLTMRRKENLSGYLFVWPWLLGFLAFFAYPLLYSLVLAFSTVQDPLTFKVQFSGLTNFLAAFREDVYFGPMLWESAKNTLINTPLVIIFSFFIAVLLNRKLRFKGFFRVAFLLPVVIGTGYVYSVLSGSNANVTVGAVATGDAASATQSLSLQDLTLTENLKNLLGEDLTGILTTILGYVSEALWTSGIQIIIFLGALQTVPSSLYEAAYCDGATEWEKFWKITLPMCAPTILLVIVYTLIDYFTSLDNEVMQYIVRTGSGDLQYARSSAMGWSYFLCIGILLVLVFVVMRKANTAE